MLIAAFPRLLFWPAVDWSMALVDVVRVILAYHLPDGVACRLRTGED